MANYKSPESLHPYNNVDGNYLWIKIEAFELEYQTTYNKRGGGIARGRVVDTFQFLAPISWQESLNHEWGEYESVASRIANKIQTGAKALAEIEALAGLEKTMGKDMFGKGKGIENRAVGVINNFLKGAGTAKVPKTRIDSPLVYTNSPRREYNWTFNLVSTHGNPQKEVLDPVRRLFLLSSPDIKGEDAGIGIKLPNIFRLSTEPVTNILRVEDAALISVQPTWYEPYSRGIPTRCELTLTFKDMSPLYRRTIEQGSAGVRIIPDNTKED